ncbi:diguanylate cyclase domain-containing protein [Aminobacterium mobile]|uniref:diguanylate cyclase domain-containing protein n=1 Tax=Aminobacterium mobile TaxID=81467 RepID=UPI0033159923
MKENTSSRSWKKILVPQFLSILIILLLYSTRNSFRYSTIIPLWGFLLLSYVAGDISYIILTNRQENSSAMWGHQFLIQGILIIGCSIVLGHHPIISWSGVTVAIVGFILLSYNYCLALSTFSPQQQSFSSSNLQKNETQEEAAFPTKMFFHSFPLPILVEENGEIHGNVAAQNILPPLDTLPCPFEKFIKTQSPIPTILPLPSGRWTVSSSESQGIKGYILSPFKEHENDVKILKIMDRRTGLFSREYADLRSQQELARSYRYRRWLSFILLKFAINDPGKLINEEMEQELFVKFCSKLRQNVRSTDLVFQFEEDKILILMPETPRDGIKSLASRILDTGGTLFDNIEGTPLPQCCKAKLRIGSVFVSGNEKVEYTDILSSLESSLVSQVKEEY